MQLAVIERHESGPLGVYRANMLRELAALNVRVKTFPEDGAIPSCDLVWEPGLCARRIPRVLADSNAPVVGTLHDLSFFSLSREEMGAEVKSLAYNKLIAAFWLHDWGWYGGKTPLTVAASERVAGAAIASLKLPERAVKVVSPGIDHGVFSLHAGWQSYGRPYFFYSDPGKNRRNVERVFKAYAALPSRLRPDLVAVVPEFDAPESVRGAHVIRKHISPAERAKWYRGAVCSIVAAQPEFSRLPVIESMACGCPVIVTGAVQHLEAAEGGNAAVSTRFGPELVRVMKRLSWNRVFWRNLRERGLVHSRQFTWRRSAEKLSGFFSEIISGKIKEGMPK